MNYTGCANPNNDPMGDWCPTELNEDGEFSAKSRKWGYCSDNCPKNPGNFNCNYHSLFTSFLQ